jgi:hypothetical protein
MDRRDHLDALIDSGAALLEIPIAPEWREAIRFHLDISLGLSAVVTDFSLPDEFEPAPVFRA